MVLCWIALPIFAVLGIFSVKYRKLTLDALDCMFRTITLRKCHSGLDKRIKAHITGTILKYSPPVAKFVQKYYAVLSWVFVLLFFWSLITGAIGLYNFAQYGNCNGPESTGFCVFDPTGQNSHVSETELDLLTYGDPVIPTPDDTDPVRGDPNATLSIIEFGCYACPYTHNAEPVLDEILKAYEGKVNLHFRSFIIPSHPLSKETAIAAECADSQGVYWQMHDALMKAQLLNEGEIFTLAESIVSNMTTFRECYDAPATLVEINQDISQGMGAKVIGTPTFFINNQTIVGPKPFRTFSTIIDRELKG